jgi:carboxyl-terminal processing protease
MCACALSSDARFAQGAPRAGQSGSGYPLSRAAVFSRVLSHVNDEYVDGTRLSWKRMCLGALESLERDVPEFRIDRLPEQDPKQVTVHVGGATGTLALEPMGNPRALQQAMQQVFAFIEQNLGTSATEDRARRLLDIEIAATNGMLYVLDPHSVLLEPDRAPPTQRTGKDASGGVGVVLDADRRGRITVRQLTPDSPARRAGIQANDRIVRIERETATNLTVQEVVDRLRGRIGSSVDVTVERKGLAAPRKFTIVRDTIKPRVLDLPARIVDVSPAPGQPPVKVGYLAIAAFPAYLEAQLREALDRFERERVKGIVLDLRGNSGGLYEQVHKVVDAFVDSGVLMATAGLEASGRKPAGDLSPDPKMAAFYAHFFGGASEPPSRRERSSSGRMVVRARHNRDVKVPLAVLVDEAAMGAAEIAAGALKGLDRAVIIGEPTFGKGSLQTAFAVPLPEDRSVLRSEKALELRLTTARILMPGNVSLQATGVTPDIELVRMLVAQRGDEAWISLQPSPHRRGESDYQWHLPPPKVQENGRPLETLAYLDLEPRAQDPADDGDDVELAAAVERSADAPEGGGSDFPAELARHLIAQARSAGRQDLVERSRQFLDSARAEQDRKLQAALAKLGVDWTPNPGSLAGTIEISLVGPKAPVAAGQAVRLRGTVKNAGSAPVYRVRAILSSDDRLFDQNEMVFGMIAPGATKTYDLVVRIPRGTLTRTDVIRAEVLAQGRVRVNTAEATLEIKGMPRPLFAFSYQTIDDVVGNRDGRVQRGEQVRTLVRVKNIGDGPSLRTEAALRNVTGQDGIVITTGHFEAPGLAPGATSDFAFVFEVSRDFRGDELLLDVLVYDNVLDEATSGKIRIKLASPSAISPAAGGGAAGSPASVSPPLLSVRAPGVVQGPTVHLQGSVTPGAELRDVYVRVWNREAKLPPRKVFYQASQPGQTGLTFAADVPLWPGSNLVQVRARGGNEVESVRSLMVLRRQ